MAGKIKALCKVIHMLYTILGISIFLAVLMCQAELLIHGCTGMRSSASHILTTIPLAPLLRALVLFAVPGPTF